MAYLLYSLLALTLLIGTALYLTRTHWLPLLPERIIDILYSIPSPTTSYTRLRSGSASTTFRDDVEEGLHSTAFDLTSNITEGDERAGLDPKTKRDVQRLMKVRGIGFDEARKVYMEQRFKREGIGRDGVPRDPKFVSFS